MKLTLTGFKGLAGSWDLPRRTILHGPMGVGKTAITEAICIALLGYLPRLGKRPADLLELGRSGWAIRLDLDGGDWITRKLTPTAKGGSLTTSYFRSGEMKAAKQAEVLIGEDFGADPCLLDPGHLERLQPAERRSEWARLVGGNATAVDIGKALADAGGDNDVLIRHYTGPLLCADQVVEAMGALREAASAERKTCAELKGAVASAVPADGEPVEALEAQLADAQLALTRSGEPARMDSVRKATGVALVDARARVGAPTYVNVAERLVRQAHEALAAAPLPETLPGQRQRIADIGLAIAQASARGKAALAQGCPKDGSACPLTQATASQALADVRELRAELAKAQAIQAQIDDPARAEAIRAHDAAARVARVAGEDLARERSEEGHRARALADVARLEMELAALPPATPVDEAEVETLMVQVAGLRDRLAAARKAAAQADALADAKARLAVDTVSYDKIVATGKALETVRGKLAAEAAGPVKPIMDAIFAAAGLPWTAWFEVGDDVTMGIETATARISTATMSGGQKWIYRVVLGWALAQAAGTQAIILAEGAEVPPCDLEPVLTALEGNGVVIVADWHPIEVPGYTVVEVTP